MDKKLSITALIGAGVTAAVILIVQMFIGGAKDTLDEGSEAIQATKDAALIAQIEELMEKKNVAIINGETMTYGEALNAIATDLAVQGSQIAALAQD